MEFPLTVNSITTNRCPRSDRCRNIFIETFYYRDFKSKSLIESPIYVYHSPRNLVKHRFLPHLLQKCPYCRQSHSVAPVVLQQSHSFVEYAHSFTTKDSWSAIINLGNFTMVSLLFDIGFG